MRRLGLHLRFGPRSILAASAIVPAFAGGCAESRARREEYSQLHRKYEKLAAIAIGIHSEPDPVVARQEAADKKYFDRLARKYGRAALFPWWPVAPDPPEPG